MIDVFAPMLGLVHNIVSTTGEEAEAYEFCFLLNSEELRLDVDAWQRAETGFKIQWRNFVLSSRLHDGRYDRWYSSSVWRHL